LAAIKIDCSFFMKKESVKRIALNDNKYMFSM
jgi:hypothetical protein